MSANRFTVSILSVSTAGKNTSSDKYLIRCADNKANNKTNISCTLDSAGTLVISGEESVVSNNRSLNKIKESVKKIVFEKGIIGIGPETFKDFTNLKEIVVSSTVSYIDRGAFMNCEKLSKVFIAHGIKSLGDNCFMSCISLKSVIIPSGTVRIGSGCFENCCNLSDVTIPDSIKIVGKHAFCNCVSLKSFDLPVSVVDIGEDIFAGCVLLNDNSVPVDVTDEETGDQVCNIDQSYSFFSSDITGNDEKISIFELSSLDYYITRSFNSSKTYRRNKLKKNVGISNAYESIFSQTHMRPAGINSRI